MLSAWRAATATLGFADPMNVSDRRSIARGVRTQRQARSSPKTEVQATVTRPKWNRRSPESREQRESA